MADLKYPVYVPSRGRFENCLTAKFLIKDGTPFFLCVRSDEVEEYQSRYGGSEFCTILVVDEPLAVGATADMGLKVGDGLLYARNWIRDHAEHVLGAARHTQFDDNIVQFRRNHKGKRIPCSSRVAIPLLEGFSDRYTNVGLSGFNYTMFVTSGSSKPFVSNCHVYSATMVNHAMPIRWRIHYNDDTDICLNALSNGWATVLFNAFTVDKLRTMVMGGGNTDDLYQGDGRTTMSRDLERLWPGIVETKRRFGRPQHVVKNSWKDFQVPLIRRVDAQPVGKGGMKYVAQDEIQSDRLKTFVDEQNS